MIVNRRYFPEKMLDNDDVFFGHLSGVVESIDEYAMMEITKVPDSFHVRVVPSLPLYNMLLLDEILKLSNLYKLRLDLSKSIKTTGTLSFNININLQ